MEVLRILVVSEAAAPANDLLAALPLARLGLGEARVVEPEALGAALDAGSWGVVLAVFPIRGQGVGELFARARRGRDDLLFFAASFSPPADWEREMLAAVQAGARHFVPGRSAAALGLLIERELAERREQRALRRQSELVLAAAGEGIYGLDLEGRTTFINPAAARMIDWPVEALLGEPQHRILHHSHADGSPYPREECPIYAAFTDGAVHHVDDEVFWRKDGTSFPVEYISTPMREGDEVIGAVVTFRDISRRRAQEKALEQNLAELERSRAELLSTLEQLVSTEDMVLAGLKAGAAAAEARGALARIAARLPAGGEATGELASAGRLLEALEQLTTRSGHPRAPRVDLQAEVEQALGAPGAHAPPPVLASVDPADLRAALRMLTALLGPGAEARVTDDAGGPALRLRGLPGERGVDDTLALLLVRRLVGRNEGSLEARREPGGALTVTLTFAPADG